MNIPAKIALRGLAVLVCLALLIVAGQIFLVLHPGLILRHHISHGIFPPG